MNKIFKNHLSLCTFTTAILFFVHNADANLQRVDASLQSVGEGGIKGDLSPCGRSGLSYRCSNGQTNQISKETYQLTDKNSDADTAIEVSKKGTIVEAQEITVGGFSSVDSVSEKGLWKYGVKASEEGRIILKNSNLSGVLVGVNASRGSISMQGGSIDAIRVAVSVTKEEDRVGASANGVEADRGGVSDIYLDNMEIKTNGVGVKIEGKGNVVLKGVSLSVEGNQIMKADGRSENSAFYALRGGNINFMKGRIDVTNAHLFSLQGNGHIFTNVENSTITIRGDAYGMRLEGEMELNDPSKKEVVLVGTDFIVPNKVAVYSSKSNSSINLFQGARLLGDLLLRAENNSSVMVNANASAIVGGVRVDESSTVRLQLSNNSQWFLLRPRHNNLHDFNSIGDLSVSSVLLYNSSIVFEEPRANTSHDYQTMRIGKGSDVVYRAYQGWIHMNARLDPSVSNDNQVADRLLIHGNVRGKTIVHVRGISGVSGEESAKAHSISLIQVYGEARNDSFQLNGQYVTLGGAPYKYVLRSYAPRFTVKEEHMKQRFVKDDKFINNNEPFWNFRLENQYVVSDEGISSTVSENTPPVRISVADIIPEHSVESTSTVDFTSTANAESSVDVVSAVRSVVPQVPTYLLLPNSLFHIDLMDISNKNEQLEILRTISNGTLEVYEKPALFLRSYGGHYHYASDLSALEYGYGGDLGYKAIEASALLQTIESMYGTMSFGVMGTYGKLSLQPQDVEYSQKSVFDKWIATAYATMQHDAGFYVDGLFSYGLLKGDVLTLARDKTATLKSKPLSVSLTGGQPLATGYKGFVFDPQVQVVYQNLQFDQARDIDNFDIEMGRLDQWVARVGGRLIKTPTGSEGVNAVAFYSKLYLTHAFGKEQTVHFKDAFKLGAFGSSLEAGLGFNAQLSSKFALHGDLVYQHKLTKAGFSGISFSGGLRYRF
ncbi:autotransporter outer membrane beta-barrel domain-containing protein [Bartonella sp. OT172YNZD]|uniref:autotransporter outer membrane beta-barrel domain-containing protein n=1 Tax=Bartonella sp. OT172YNZD TaxID=3243572 RepID=UPI0035CF5F0C